MQGCEDAGLQGLQGCRVYTYQRGVSGIMADQMRTIDLAVST